jgi:DNA polymerase III epsilon subunit-like protein
MVIFYDGEYSGLDTSSGHGILSLAGIDGNDSNNRFYLECKLNKFQKFDSESLKYIGLSEEEIYSGENRESLEKSIKSFRDWFLNSGSGKKSCLVSQNNPKDLEQLWNGFKIVGVSDPLHYRNLDLHSVAVTYHLLEGIEIPSNDKYESNLNSSYLSSLVGIPDEPKPHSTALLGALQTAEIYNRLIFGKNFLNEFKDYKVPSSLIK